MFSKKVVDIAQREVAASLKFRRAKCMDLALRAANQAMVRTAVAESQQSLIEVANIFVEFCEDDFNDKYSALENVFNVAYPPSLAAEYVQRADEIYRYIKGED